jgi:hypothetical protein
VGVGDAEVGLVETFAQDLGTEPAIGLELAQVVEEAAQGRMSRGARTISTTLQRSLKFRPGKTRKFGGDRDRRFRNCGEPYSDDCFPASKQPESVDIICDDYASSPTVLKDRGIVKIAVQSAEGISSANDGGVNNWVIIRV